MVLLADLSDSDLRHMGKRLTKSHEDFQQALEELQCEQEVLQKEKLELNDTISFMMAELRKLNIRAENLSEPQLDEGPVEFVGRMWEKLKPRDNAIALSSNVGELRHVAADGEQSPMQAATERLKEQMSDQFLTLSSAIAEARNNVIPTPHGGVSPQDLGRHVSERGQELGKQVADNFSTLYRSISEAATPTAEDGEPSSVGKKFESALSFFSQASESFFAATNSSPTAGEADAAPSVGSLFSYLRTPSMQQELGADSAGPGDDDPPPQAAKPPERDQPMQKEEFGGSSSSSSGSRTASAEFTRAPGPGAAAGAGYLADTSPPVVAAVAAPALAPVLAPAPATPKVMPEAEKKPEPNSTLLVQVQLTLGDGSVETVEMRAADRCKEVAARFIQEHSLKECFEAPLGAFLSEVENNAETFPVKLEAELDEIRRNFNAKS